MLAHQVGERDPRLALFQDAHDLTFRKPGLPHSHSFQIARKSNILWYGTRGSLQIRSENSENPHVWARTQIPTCVSGFPAETG